MSADPNAQPPTSRYGAQRYSRTTLVRKGVQADEADPTSVNQGWFDPEHTQARWAIFPPSWIVTYTLTVWAWIEEKTGVYSGWVEVDTVTGISDKTLYYQYTDGSPIAVTITDIVGVVGADGFAVLITGINRP